jgi:pilus assembly protein TadC
MVRTTFQDIATNASDDALRLLTSSSAEGLPPEEAARRLAEYGPNELSGT